MQSYRQQVGAAHPSNASEGEVLESDPEEIFLALHHV